MAPGALCGWCLCRKGRGLPGGAYGSSNQRAHRRVLLERGDGVYLDCVHSAGISWSPASDRVTALFSSSQSPGCIVWLSSSSCDYLHDCTARGELFDRGRPFLPWLLTTGEYGAPVLALCEMTGLTQRAQLSTQMLTSVLIFRQNNKSQSLIKKKYPRAGAGLSLRGWRLRAWYFFLLCGCGPSHDILCGLGVYFKPALSIKIMEPNECHYFS